MRLFRPSFIPGHILDFEVPPLMNYLELIQNMELTIIDSSSETKMTDYRLALT